MKLYGKIALVLGAASSMFVVHSASADSVELTLTGLSANLGTPSAPEYVWTYDAVLTPDNQVETGDSVYLTLFNQGNQAGVGSATFSPVDASADYTDGVVAASFSPPSPFGTITGPGLLFTYDGSSPLQNVGPTGPNIDLGSFLIKSQYNLGQTGLQATTDLTISTDEVGLYQQPTTVAAPGGFTVTPLPPSIFGAAGLLGLVAVGRSRRSSAVVS